MALFGRKKKEETPVVGIQETPAEQEEPGKKKRKNPQDDQKRSRSAELKLRLTPEEKSLLTGLAKEAGMSTTDYILSCCSLMTPVTITDVPDLILEIRKLGTNINQLARLANARQDTRSVDLKQAAADAAAARETVLEFCQRWDAQIVNPPVWDGGIGNGNHDRREQ